MRAILPGAVVGVDTAGPSPTSSWSTMRRPAQLLRHSVLFAWVKPKVPVPPQLILQRHR
jgi:hypothetical protein